MDYFLKKKNPSQKSVLGFTPLESPGLQGSWDKHNSFLTGFTLIELIIYIGIVAAVLLVIFNFGWDIIYGNTKSQAMREVQQNTRLAMEKITQSILAASDINSPGQAATNTSLSLTMQDTNLNPTLFELADGKIMISQGLAGPYELTNNRVKVTNLQFSNVSYPNTPGAIKIQITIEHINPNNLTQYVAFLATENTISLRK